MEVVHIQGESEKSKLSLNERNLLAQGTSSPLSINDNEETVENKIKMANKFRRVFPSSDNNIMEKTPALQNLNENNMSNDSSSIHILNSNENSSFSNDELGSGPHLMSSTENEKSVASQLSNNNGKGVGEISAKINTDKVSEGVSIETQENNDGGLKIHMVTTLDGSDIFVEAHSGPTTPEATASNPLESDKDETSDSITAMDGCEQSAVDRSFISSTSKNNMIIEKDEQSEVITGDKTISPEYIKTNLNSSGDKVDGKDHGYSKKPDEGPSGNRESGKKVLKVIYPKKKVTEYGQLKITKLTTPAVHQCIQCSTLTLCETSVDISGSQCYLCSDECLKLHKTEQINALQRKNIPAVPTAEQQEAGLESRICVNCDTNVSLLPDDKILSWETMEFCNEDCLGKYQSKMWSFCTACKKDVPPSSMGKYCVRFGHEVKQFCSGICLEDFKKGIKVCCYCQKDLSENDEGFLAPIGEKGQFRDFCSQICLDEYYCMSNNIPGGGLKVENCSVCNKNQLVQVQVLMTPNNTVNLCSVVCLAAFKFVNTAISTVPCFMCKKYFDKSLPSWVTVYYESELLTFCSKSCMNINILAKRKIVACNWCKVKKYNFDMIRRKSGGHVSNWCSVNCMALYQVSVNVVTTTNKRKPCTQCKKMELPSFHLTMSDATARNFCSMECVDTFQKSFPNLLGGIVASGQLSKLSLQPLSSSILYSKTLPTQSIENRPSPHDTPTCAGSVNQSVTITVKKPEIKVISSASMNGPLQATLSPETTQPPIVQAASPTPQQIIRNQILIIPKSQPKMVNAKLQVRPYTCSKSVTAKIKQMSKSSQTEEKDKGLVLVPIPVPIYIPCPMAMYSIPVPTPVPVPIPIPVPVFIPTTKNTAEEILADIKRIQEQIPGNPYEAELIMMAEMAEGHRNTTEESNMPIDNPQKRQKRPVSDILDGDNVEPPDKKQKECSEDNSLGSTIHHLAISRVPMSLKETLGVSAWKHYASQIGEATDLLEMRSGALAQALRSFIKNAKIPSGGHYTPDQKYYLMLGIQYYLEENGRIDNIFYDQLMDPFIEALDEDAKSFQNLFTESDSIITRVEEEHLWESKQLGPSTPYTLLATLIYFNTKYFNLTTLEEHKQLSFKDVIKHWRRYSTTSQPLGNSTGNTPVKFVLRYKTPDSALESNPKKQKMYEQESNLDDPYRCPIHLYEFYLSKCPESVRSRNDLYYLCPERSCSADSPIWFSTVALPDEVIVRTLNRFKMVKEINLSIISSL